MLVVTQYLGPDDDEPGGAGGLGERLSQDMVKIRRKNEKSERDFEMRIRDEIFSTHSRTPRLTS